jgi:hypothetical protein
MVVAFVSIVRIKSFHSRPEHKPCLRSQCEQNTSFIRVVAVCRENVITDRDYVAVGVVFGLKFSRFASKFQRIRYLDKTVRCKEVKKQVGKRE